MKKDYLAHLHKYLLSLLMEAIYAVDASDGLSKDGVIPWHSKKDMRFFLEKTRHHVVIMGRKTYFSLPKRPLKDRLNIVLTNCLEEERKNPNVVFTNMDLLSSVIPPDAKVFVIGGKNVYEQLLPQCKVVWVTKLKKSYDCDLFLTVLFKDGGEKIEEDDELVIRKYTL